MRSGFAQPGPVQGGTASPQFAHELRRQPRAEKDASVTTQLIIVYIIAFGRGR